MNPDLTASEREETHAMNLPHIRNKMVGHVGEWYCVVDGYIKWLPDPSEFEGETEQDRVEAAFDELVRRDLLALAKQTRKGGGDEKVALERRRAAFDGVFELIKIDSESFEEAEPTQRVTNDSGG
jgi:hypothetical protein